MATNAELLAALERDVLEAAPMVLGMYLVRGDLRARVVEVEAYRADDPACHAFGKSKMKNMALFEEPGKAYVYFTYGNHWMLNIVAHPHGDPAAILIRAAEPLAGLDEMRLRRLKAKRDEDLLSGPGKLAAAFGITGEQNGTNLLSADSDLRLVHGSKPGKIVAGPRIGIAVGKAHEYPWRWVDSKRMRWVSKPWPQLPS